MNLYEFIKDQGATIVTCLTLLVLWYQIASANQQFRLLNKGYLHAEPRLDIAGDNVVIVRRITGEEQVAPDTVVDALNPVVLLSNLGNLPLKYRVRNLDIWINDEQRTGAFQANDHVIGVLFPRQEKIEFRIPGIRLRPTGSMPFSEIINLRIRMRIRIEYHAGKEEPSTLDREFGYRFMLNAGHWTIVRIDDKW